MVFRAQNVGSQFVRSQLRAGHWTRVRRGAFVETAFIDGDAGTSATASRATFDTRRRFALAHAAAVALQKSKDIVFSHESAALLWGLPLWRVPTATHVAVRVYGSQRSLADVRHHFIKFDDADVVSAHGLRLTSLTRTVFDCARHLSPAQALTVADGALAVGASISRIRELIEDHPGARGIRQAREVLEIADAGAESPWESFARLNVLALGLPQPSLQVRVVTRLGTYFLDMAWEEWKVALEYDGLVKYTDLADGDPGRVLFEEKRRQNAIEEEGWRFIRLTRDDLRNPDDLLMRLSRYLPAYVIANRTPRLHLLIP